MNFYLGIFITLVMVKLEATVIVSSTEFKSVVTSSAFVDKTLLIKQVLESKHNILVTTPHKFGKSTNIDMIKTFLEIEVDESGVPKTDANITNTPINDTENYEYFTSNQLKITEHPDVMLHLGRTPVIRVDFKRELPQTCIRCLFDVIKLCKEVVHTSYMAHEYLLFSDALSLENKQVIRTWCDEHSYKTKIDNLFVSHGLLSLSQFLYKHFNGRKVFVLVDDHDFLITRASYDVEKDVELEEIVDYIFGLIGDIVNDNVYVGGTLITGVSQIPRTRNVQLTNFQTYKFLEDHAFGEFFGFTRKEVGEVINKSENYLDDKEIQLFYTNYNGYHRKNRVYLYDIYFVLMFLKLKRTGRHCKIHDYPPQALEILKRPTIKVLLDRLLKEGILQVQAFSQTSTSDIEVRKCLRGTYNQSEDSQFLLYLLNWGLLTYTRTEVQISEKLDSIKFPNNEIKAYLLEFYGAI